MSNEAPKLLSRRQALGILGLGSAEAAAIWVLTKDGLREANNKESSSLDWEERSGVYIAGEEMEVEYSGKKYSVRVNEQVFLEVLSSIANEDNGVDSLNMFLAKYPLHISLGQETSNQYAHYVQSQLSDTPMIEFSKVMLGDYLDAGLTGDPDKLILHHTVVMHELLHTWQDARGSVLNSVGPLITANYFTTPMIGGVIVGNNLSDRQDLKNNERSNANKISRRIFNCFALSSASVFAGLNLESVFTPDELEAYARGGQLALEPENIQYINQFFQFEEMTDSSL